MRVESRELRPRVSCAVSAPRGATVDTGWLAQPALAMNPRIVRALATGIALTAGMRPPANAQSARDASTDDQTVRLSPVVVTGSHFAEPAGSAALPVTVVGPTEMAESGVSTSLLDILRRTMPQLTGNSSRGLENAGSVAFFSMGGSSVTVHNLGTLVLVNGRRVAFDPAEAAVGDQFVDVNMIPPSAVDRVEILSDGASAIYGSDAVGGVVNIILKSRFEGWQAGVHWGETSNRGAYTERSGYLTGGVGNGTTSIVLSVEGTRTSPIYLSQRPYTDPMYGTTNYPGVIDVVNFQTRADTFYRLAPGRQAPPAGGGYTIDELVQMGVYVPQTSEQIVGGYNLAGAQTLVASLRRHSLVASAEHKFRGDRLVFFGDLIYGVTDTESSLGGQGVTAYVSTPMIDFAQFQTSPAPPGFPYVPATQANSPFSPDWINQGNLVTAHTQFPEFRVLTRVKANFTRVTGGLRGAINPDYTWETGINLNRYRLRYTSPGQIDAAALVSAFAAGTLNPFALTQPAGALPGDVIGTRYDDMSSTLTSYDVLLRGSPLEMPAGKVSFALGGSYTREHLTAAPDGRSLPNGMGIPAWVGFQSFSPFDASRDIASAFAEVRLPVVGGTQPLPGIHDLTVDIAARFDRYSVVGHSTVPEASVRYQPFDGQFTLRASGGKSFSAPTLFELFGPVQSGQIPPVSFNNFGGGRTEQAVFNGFGGSNRGLQPAKARTWSAGFIFTPRRWNRFQLSGDYFQVVDKGEIGYLSIPAIVQTVELQGPASPYAQYVHVGGPAAPGVTGPGQLSTANPASIFIHVPLINLSSQSMKGFDATLKTPIPAPAAAGEFDLRSSLTVYNSYLLQAIPTEDYYQYAGHASGGNVTSSSQGTVPRWRTYTALEWRYHGVNAVVAQTYVPSVTDIGPGGSTSLPPVHVSSYQQYDASLAYEFARLPPGTRGGLQVRLGVNNVFNRMPPLAPNAFPSTRADVAAYNGAIGRFYYVDASYRF